MSNRVFSYQSLKRMVTEVSAIIADNDSGAPNREKIFSYKNLTTTLLSLVLLTIASTYLDK